MPENRLPCLDLLDATPGILRGLMSEVTDEDAALDAEIDAALSGLTEDELYGDKEKVRQAEEAGAVSLSRGRIRVTDTALLAKRAR